jgi:hypothetical protein
MAYTPTPGINPEWVPAEQYRYALSNFRIAHEKVESQRKQLEEQERQVATLRARIAQLEGGHQTLVTPSVNERAGGSTVDDFSIKNAASQLERVINRWAAEMTRTQPVPLQTIGNAVLQDLAGPGTTVSEFTEAQVQNLLRHALSETICEGVINCLMITNSSEANIQLSRIHEHILARDPTVASVWRRQTFSAAIEHCSPEMCGSILRDHVPTLLTGLVGPAKDPPPPLITIIDQGFAFSRMLHASKSSGGSDAFYRAFVPDLGSVLYPRQVELVKRCLKSERGEMDRVGACIFPGLVKAGPGGVPLTPNGGQNLETSHIVVRRAQVICQCALGMGYNE